MPNKINKSRYAITNEQVNMLKEKINDPKYMNKAVYWIAKQLANKFSNTQ